MKRRLLSLFLVGASLICMLSACGEKEEPKAEETVSEATEEVAEETTEEVEKEAEPEVPQMVEVEYQLVERNEFTKENFFRFSEGLSWVSYYDDKIGEKYGVIDTDGNLVYSLDVEAVFGENRIDSVGVTPFFNGKSVVYYKDKGFIIIDNKGEVVLDQTAEENTWFTGYTDEGEMFCTTHSTGFSEDVWKVFRIKADGTTEDLALALDEDCQSHDDAVFANGSQYGIAGKIFKIADGIYIKNYAILNLNKGKMIYAPYDLRGVSGDKVEFNGGNFCIPFEEIAAIDSSDDIYNMKIKDLFETRGIDSVSYYRLLNDGNIVCQEERDSKNYAIFDIDGNKKMSLPDIVDYRECLNDFCYDGKYAACIARGVDEDYYALLINEKGEMAYEPLKIGESYSSQTCAVANGHIFVNGEERKQYVISPEGKIIEDGNLSSLGDALLLYTGNANYYTPVISEGFIYYPIENKMCSFDGKKEIVSVKTEVPYEETQEEESYDDSYDDDYAEELRQKVAKDLAENAFIGKYNSADGKNEVNIAEDSISISVNGKTFNTGDNFYNMDVNSRSVYIYFDDGMEANFCLAKDDKYLLTFYYSNDSAIENDKEYHFFAV